MNIVVDPPQRHTGLNMHSNQPGARESDEKRLGHVSTAPCPRLVTEFGPSETEQEVSVYLLRQLHALNN